MYSLISSIIVLGDNSYWKGAIFAHWFTRGGKELSLIGASKNFLLARWRQTFSLPLAVCDDYLIYTLVFDLKCYVQNKCAWSAVHYICSKENKSHEPNYIIIAFGKMEKKMAWTIYFIDLCDTMFGKHLSSMFSLNP